MTKKKTKTDNQKSARPSSPVWYNLSMSFGFYSQSRKELWELMALYQKNPVIHGCININSNGIVAAKPSLFRVVNKDATTDSLQKRKLKRLTPTRHKKLIKQIKELNQREISDEQELVEVLDHPYYKALNNDYYGQNFLSLIRLIVINLEVYGIAFLHKVKNKSGEVVDYEYLPTYGMLPNRGGNGEIIGWFYSTLYGEANMQETPLSNEDVMIFRWPSPTDPRAGGDSPLLSAIKTIELDQKWMEYMDNVIGNRARPDWAFVPKIADGSELQQEQVDKIEKKINDKHRGSRNGGIAVVPQPGTIVPLQWSPTDMAPLAYSEQLKKALFFVLGIPLAFTDNDSNRANAQAAYDQWARQSLAPIVNILESTFNKEAETYGDDIRVIFENVIPQDEEFTLQEEQLELQKWQVGVQYGGLQNEEYRVNVLGLEPDSMPEPPEETPEPIEDETPADTTEPEKEPEVAQNEAKSLDLLALNKEVALGNIDRATAISVCAFSFKIDEMQAKKLITHPKAPEEVKNGKEQTKPMDEEETPEPMVEESPAEANTKEEPSIQVEDADVH